MQISVIETVTATGVQVVTKPHLSRFPLQRIRRLFFPVVVSLLLSKAAKTKWKFEKFVV